VDEAIGYIRISDEDQSRFSLTKQEKDLKSYCKLHGLDLVRVFVDDGQSAFTFNRKEWKELERYIKENKTVKYLIIPHLDRFSRGELTSSLTKLEDIEKRLKINVRTISDPIDLDTEDIGVQLKRVMELLMSNYEWKRIKKRTTDGIYTALSQGRYVSKAPWGLMNGRSGDDKPILVIDKTKEPLIKNIYHWFNSGLELEEVRFLAQKDGFTQKGRSAIRRILENPLYAGLVRVPKTAKTPERMVKGLHQPIVSELEYWTAYNRLNMRKTVSQKHDDVYLRGALHCSECGKVMTAGKSKGKLKHYWYYFCNTHRVNFNANKVHKMFDEMISDLSISESTKNKMIDGIRKQFSKDEKEKGSELERLKSELSSVQSKIARVEEKYLLQTEMNPETFKKVVGSLKENEKNISEKINQVEIDNDVYEHIISELIPKLSNFKELFHELPLEGQHLLINMVFKQSLVLEKDGFRTLYLSPLFSDNIQKINKKGLLKIEKPSTTSGVGPVSAPGGT